MFVQIQHNTKDAIIMKFKPHELPDIYAIVEGIPENRICSRPIDLAAWAAVYTGIEAFLASGDFDCVREAPIETWLTLHPMFRAQLAAVQANSNDPDGKPSPSAHLHGSRGDQFRLLMSYRYDNDPVPFSYASVHCLSADIFWSNRQLLAAHKFSRHDAGGAYDLSMKHLFLYRVRRALGADRQTAVDAVLQERLERIDRERPTAAELHSLQVQINHGKQIASQAVVNHMLPNAGAPSRRWATEIRNGKPVLIPV